MNMEKLMVPWVLVDNILSEALMAYDREIPGFVDFKAFGADQFVWAKREILKRTMERSQAGRVMKTEIERVLAASPEGLAIAQQQAEHEISQPDSEPLPNWLSPPQASAQGEEDSQPA